MERYTTEGSESDPSPEWTAPGPETGLEESMWQLGLGPGESYPERPDEADCTYYLRTGICGYRSRCRYNHPRDRSAVTGALRAGAVEYPEQVGQPVCQYYMRTGTCKFGATCKYHHPKQGGGSAAPVSLNYYGYPLRPGERECSYYVKTGQCKFGATCKFHHPPLTGTQPQVPSQAQASIVPAPTLYQTVQSPSVSSQPYGTVMVARPPLLPSSYVQSPYGPMLIPPGMVPFSGWSPYPAGASPLASPSTQATVGSGALYGINQLSPSVPAYTGIFPTVPFSLGPPITSQKEQSHPERPGQAECQYFLRTGDCKFGSSCRYHHPAEVAAPKTPVALSSIGLPSRPGSPLCTHYVQYGACKSGPACKFNHPMGTLSYSPHPMGTLSYSPSASSLTDMPVAPYPVGSSIGTLAPSSSSAELWPELNSGTSKDSVSARMSSSLSTVSGSVGSTVSKDGVSIVQQDTKQSKQNMASSSSSLPLPSTDRQSEYRYEVFLSFRGEDTSYTFIDNLHRALDRRGIRTFRDNKLNRGEDISQELLKAIEESRVSIIVLSPNYASSRWCLDELVQILECRRSKGQEVKPVFYKVNPSDVRKQTGAFGDGFAELDQSKYVDKICKWRKALEEAADLSGWPCKDGEYEAKFIDDIVGELSAQVVNRSCMLHVAAHPVGLESCRDDVNKLLDLEESVVRMVGIWGAGGIGKTTIAKDVFNSIRHKFEGSCFLLDVRSNSNGLAQLQETLLFDVLGYSTLRVSSVDQGVGLIKTRMQRKKVLIKF